MTPKKFLDNYLISKVGKKDFESIKNKNLISSGIIDSLDIVTLSVMVKKKFKIDFVINSQNTINIFESYKLILQTIEKKWKKK